MLDLYLIYFTFASVSTIFCSLLCSTRQKTVNLTWHAKQTMHLCKLFQAINRVWAGTLYSMDNLCSVFQMISIPKHKQAISPCITDVHGLLEDVSAYVWTCAWFDLSWSKYSSNIVFATNRQMLVWQPVWIQIGEVQESTKTSLFSQFCFVVCLCVKETVGDLNLLNPASLWENPSPLCPLESSNTHIFQTSFAYCHFNLCHIIITVFESQMFKEIVSVARPQPDNHSKLLFLF